VGKDKAISLFLLIMASPNFTYSGTLGTAGVGPETKTFEVASGTTASIAIGDVVVVTAGYAAKVANGGMTSAGKYGLAVSASTETSSAVGIVDVQFTPVGLIVKGIYSTTATQSQLFTGFKIAVSGAVQTVDLGNAGVATLWTQANPAVVSTTTLGHVVLPWAV
jgi:hypothetical protein